jgi:DNA-binding NarL/FixJ family response regulator
MTISVFLADDHTVVRDGLRAILEAQRDIRVVGEATNGREAARRVAEIRPDVVVMDIGMPELNGVEATRLICERCPSVQVIILSMHATSEYIRRSLQAGARGYLLKDSAGAEVVQAVRAVHAGRRHLSQRVSEQILDEFPQPRSSAQVDDPLSLLSPREREVLQLVVEGKTSAEIAQLIFLSPKTVETYRSRVMTKLGVADLPGLVKFAIQHGVTQLE